MIVVDTSALLAVCLSEAGADQCMTVLAAEQSVLISAGTLAEALIVAERRGVDEEIERLVEVLGIEVVPLTLASSRLVARAYARWGRGVHRAALNFGDCFAYALAKERGRRLLYVGKDFSKTDIESAI